MPRKPSEVFTEKELEIMKVVWQLGEASVKDIQERLPGEPHYNSVLTIIRVLDRNGKYLARTLKMVQAHNRDEPLPTVSQVGPDERIRIEEENVKACLSYAREKQL